MNKIFIIIVILLLAVLGRTVQNSPRETVSAQQSDKINSRREFLEASRERVVEVAGLRLPNASVEVERIILEEAKAIDRIAGFSTPIGVTNGGGTFSHPNAGIGLDLEELQRIREQSNVRQFRQFVRFILAHEKSHQFQYLRYSQSSVRSDDPEQRRIYECQADLLAGKVLTESFDKPSAEDQEVIVDALRVAFDIGTEEYTAAADHPSREARRTAVRLGMARGMLTGYEKLPRTPFVAEMIIALAAKTNTLQGEDVMGWSYRLAKRIIHYSQAASSNIRLEQKSIKWDERAINPIVTFSLTYKNTGQRTVKIDMEIQCALVPRDDPSDTLRWLKWSLQNYAFILRPGQTYTASGFLVWGCNDPENRGFCPDYSKLMPSLIFPPDATALMSCEYVE